VTVRKKTHVIHFAIGGGLQIRGFSRYFASFHRPIHQIPLPRHSPLDISAGEPQSVADGRQKNFTGIEIFLRRAKSQNAGATLS
jgi:hypothetical protein